ncbi:MAG: OmpA family protein [Crocinitomicaceae bacterium]|nr:OmpA family protein [Crocinitomicaceae bacterium]
MKIKIGLTIFLLGLASVSQAQNKAVQKARVTFASERYYDGIKDCSVAYKKITRKGNQAKKMKGEMAYKTAECYRYTEQFREANNWYTTALLLDYQDEEADVHLKNAEMLKMMTEYEKAIKQYELYLAIVPDSDLATVGLESCRRNNEFIAEKTKHVIENQIAINTDQYDMAPMFGDRKGKRMYWSSSRDGAVGKDSDPRTGESYMSLWASDVDKKGNWTKPYLVKGDGVNTIDNEGTIAFDSRFKKMFFTRCPNMKKENLGCDIWMSEAKSKTEWKEPTKILGLKTNDSVSVGHPCTMDGKYLIFASDMAGGFGGRDLWYTQYDKKSDSWSAPANMGPGINTKGNELFPSFGLNGELIYASDGMAGMGGLDIFKVARVGEENKWENPTNLGSPINGPNNDYALIEVTPRLGYFTSERKSVHGETNPDIYSYVMPPNLFSLKVNVTELVDQAIVLEDVRVAVVGSDGSKWEGYSDDNGSVFWDKRPTEDATYGTRYINEEISYEIHIFGDETKYHPVPDGQKIATVGLDYNQDFIVDMVMIPKKPIRLPEVRYALNSWELLVDSTINSKDSLLFVFDLLEEYPGMKLELSSHTDSRGSNPRNQILSENRARACYKFLVEEKGLDPKRIIPVGDGENIARIVWLKDGVYHVDEPKEDVIGDFETTKLTEAYINKFRRSDKKTFELLHGFNRRTEGDVLQMDFDSATAPEADPKYLKYLKY